MSETATLTSKGQITIPREIRRSLGVDTGDKIDFIVGPDGSVRMQVRRRDIASLAGMLHRPGLRRLTVEEMDAAIGRHLTARR